MIVTSRHWVIQANSSRYYRLLLLEMTVGAGIFLAEAGAYGGDHFTDCAEGVLKGK